jgi:hypothetical protein
MLVFLSYGASADQSTALRLQALAAVNGLTVYVPPASTRRSPALLLSSDSAAKIAESDVVLGVVASGLSESCRQELNTSLTLRKPTIVMAAPGFLPVLQPFFGSNLVVLDPANPEAAELAIVQHLKTVDAEQNAKKALLALGTIALGLLLLAPQD